MIQIALYQPDIPGNTGTIMRMAACLGVPLHIIEPAGFDLSERNLKRAGMDYLEVTNLTRHISWDAFFSWHIEQKNRLVLASTKAAQPYCDLAYNDNDVLLFGRESSGVPENVHEAVDERILIEMQPNMRSLNLAMSVAMITGEAIRQTHV
jgi:tRNA (cytidine/uridine-2'-O-)-methyltransferase